jgi:Ca-activated chloride channel family protein
MSFASPLWLAALALVPLGIAAQVLARRRAKRYVIRFPAVATLRLAAPAAMAYRRHIPAVFLLAAMAALALALARPHTTYSAPVNEASVMLVTDHSGSMAATDVQPTRLSAAISAADAFIAKLPAKARVGAIGFGAAPDAVQAPVTDHAAARAIIDAQTANGSTATGDALQLALQLLQAGNPKHPPAAIVLLSDGAANAGQDAASIAGAAGQAKIPIYTVALGTPNGTLPNPDPTQPPIAVPPDPQLMQQIAQLSGGRAFGAQSADQLNSIYNGLGTKLGSVTRKRDVTAEFAVGGLVLLLFAAAGSTRWSGRLP